MKSVELQMDEQISDVNNEELQNSTQDQSNLEEIDRASVREAPKPMQPTPLYVFLFFHFHSLYNEYHFD